MSKTDAIFMAWRTYKTLTQGQKQSDFFAQKLKDGKIVTCVPLCEVFDAKEIDVIKQVVRPEKRMCFKNAHMLTSLFPDRVKYVEGEVTICGGGIGIEHAWNLVDGEHYVDLTFELALQEDVRKEAYVAIGEYDVDTMRRVAVDTRVYGGVYDYLYREKNDVKNKKRNGKV